MVAENIIPKPLNRAGGTGMAGLYQFLGELSKLYMLLGPRSSHIAIRISQCYVPNDSTY